MPTVTVYPNGAGFYTQLKYATGATHWGELNHGDARYVGSNPVGYKPGDANLNGTVDSGDNTYIQRAILGLEVVTNETDVNQDGVVNNDDLTAVNQIILGTYPFLTRTDLYTLDDPAIPVGAIINSVTANFRIKGGPSGLSVVEAALYLGGNYGYSFAYSTSTSWSNKSYGMSRPGGGSWGYTDFAGLQAGFRMQRATDSNSIASVLEVVIDYTLALEKSLMAVIG